jgi:hypothetical protein
MSRAAWMPWALLLGACGAGGPIVEVDPELFESHPTYQRDVRPILTKHCVACHDGEGFRGGGVELDRYLTAYATRAKSACSLATPELVELFADSLIPSVGEHGVVDGPCDGWLVDRMPTSGRARMTDAERVIFLRWVETGAPQ